jgi:hypothetical protein
VTAHAAIKLRGQLGLGDSDALVDAAMPTQTVVPITVVGL